MNRPRVATHVIERIAAHRDIVLSIIVGVITALLVLAIFINQANTAARHEAVLNNEIDRLAVNYARNYDQDLTLGIVPAAPSLAQVETPLKGPQPALLPRSFTAAFPTGYFTCIDVTGDRNYTCTVTTNPPAKATTTTVKR